MFKDMLAKLGRFLKRSWRSMIGGMIHVSFSALVFGFALLVFEGLYTDRWGLELIYHLTDLQSFFTSDAGKQIVAPLLVILGGVVGWITTLEARSDNVFWISFTFYSLAVATLLLLLIRLSPPVDSAMAAILESYEMSTDDNALKAFLSIVILSLSAWLANRFSKRTASKKEAAK